MGRFERADADADVLSSKCDGVLTVTTLWRTIVWSVCEWLWMMAGASVGALKGRNGDSRASIVLVVPDVIAE